MCIGQRVRVGVADKTGVRYVEGTIAGPSTLLFDDYYVLVDFDEQLAVGVGTGGHTRYSVPLEDLEFITEDI
jgi:hypothetical protein